MSYEQKNNTGSVFNNAKKTTENHPDRQGSATIDGREYWISGWVKQDRNGKPWLSLSFKRKDADSETRSRPKAPIKDEMDDAIPF